MTSKREVRILLVGDRKHVYVSSFISFALKSKCNFTQFSPFGKRSVQMLHKMHWDVSTPSILVSQRSSFENKS